VRFLANYFPPDDFAEVDRRLIATPQVHSDLVAFGGVDGRGSSGDLPFAVLGGRDKGLVVAVEWSGTWMIATRQSAPGPHDAIDLVAGLWGMDLRLRPGTSFQLPPILLIPAAADASDATNVLRRHIRRHVTPSLAGEEALPPTSFNSWFAFENQVSESRLRPAVLNAAMVGLEYFVVDGGWYRDGFRRGIGNWDEPDRGKFPSGFAPFAQFVEQHGMRFGTWFEPEFAHVGSELERSHPDWFLDGPRSSPYTTPANWQYGAQETEFRMLDFGLPEVQEHWVQRIRRAYEDWNVRWIRWDFNQQPRPHWDQTGESTAAQIRHLRGVYLVLDEIIAAHPDLLIEQSASGGHRIDIALARRGHTFWMNDHTTHTDLVRRLQGRLNRVLPGNFANTNLCQPRHNFTDYDLLSHMAGGFGYSGRIWEAPASDLARLERATTRYRGFRATLMGDFEREVNDEADMQSAETLSWADGSDWVQMIFNGSQGIGEAEVKTGG
jgi:alpha-galactosidase